MPLTVKDSVNPLTTDPKSFRCCLCCHVKTGTLILGILFSLIQVAALGFLILATIRPDVLINQEVQKSDAVYIIQSENGDVFEHHPAIAAKTQISKERLYVAFGLTLVNLIAALVLIYGLAKNVASYLMPMFCIQVFDFCLSCLSVVSCFTYAPNVKQMMHEQGLDQYPIFDRLSCLDADYLMLLLVTLLILVLSIKAYLVGMVWSCYKYIQLYVAARSVVREYEVDPDSQMLLPPRYEDAIKPSGNPPPPAYSSE